MSVTMPKLMVSGHRGAGVGETGEEVGVGGGGLGDQRGVCVSVHSPG